MGWMAWVAPSGSSPLPKMMGAGDAEGRGRPASALSLRSQDVKANAVAATATAAAAETRGMNALALRMMPFDLCSVCHPRPERRPYE
jgi:hypothetical protein